MKKYVLMFGLILGLSISCFAYTEVFAPCKSSTTVTAETLVLETVACNVYDVAITSPGALGSSFTVYDSTAVTGGTSTTIITFDGRTIHNYNIPYISTTRGLKCISLGNATFTIFYQKR